MQNKYCSLYSIPLMYLKNHAARLLPTAFPYFLLFTFFHLLSLCLKFFIIKVLSEKDTSNISIQILYKNIPYKAFSYKIKMNNDNFKVFIA